MKNILRYYAKGGLHGRIFTKITILKHMFYKNQHILILRCFCFHILDEMNYCNSNKFELIYLNKNMITKENCFLKVLMT